MTMTTGTASAATVPVVSTDGTATAYNEATYERLWGLARFHPPSRTPWYPVLAPLAERAPRRLEVGPGMWPRLPVEGTHVVDLSTHALEGLRAHGAIPHAGLLQDVAFPDAHFDLVGIFEVLEHVDDDAALLRELARIVKPGGRLAASVPMGMSHWTAWDDYAGHVRRYEPDELRAKLAAAGFAIERFEVRPSTMGRAAAALFAPFCRAFPRLSMRITERVFLPAACREVLDWRDASEWGARTPGAGECSVLCRAEPFAR
jgi:SAM-dependent methyltransferase